MKIQFFSVSGIAIALACLVVTSCDTANEPVPSVQHTHRTERVAAETSYVSSIDAVEIAELFANGNYDSSAEIISRGVGRVLPLNDLSNEPIAHVVNFDGGGWVIVSATKKYHPILAHSDEGSFELMTAANNPGLNMWLEDVDFSIRNVEKLTADEASLIELEWMEYDTKRKSFNPGLPTGNSPEAVACRARIKELNDTYSPEGWRFTTLKYASTSLVPRIIYETADNNGSPYEYTIVGIYNNSIVEKSGPLLTTRWNQEGGFNALCPDNSAAGCVSVAMGQIMNYHKSPANFDWDNMSDTEPTYAVQYLLYQIGLTIGADYDNGGGANIVQAENGFKKLGYTVKRKNHNSSDVHVELHSWARPVYMRGIRSGDSVGHAWVCDGSDRTHRTTKVCAEYWVSGSYDTFGYSVDDPYVVDFDVQSQMLHMNWGWGGDLDGWYAEFPSILNFSEGRQNLYVSVK